MRQNELTFPILSDPHNETAAAAFESDPAGGEIFSRLIAEHPQYARTVHAPEELGRITSPHEFYQLLTRLIERDEAGGVKLRTYKVNHKKP